MKFLKLKFESARLICAKSNKNLLGSNRFFHPINKTHIYNSVCVLLGRTPKPQLRATDDKYMPFFADVMNIVEKGYIKINLLNDIEVITALKKDWNSNVKEACQFTWKDCAYITGTLLPIFIYKVSKILKISDDEVKKMAFDDVIKTIQKEGKDFLCNGELYYANKEILDLIEWLKSNSSTGIANYIENKQFSSRPTFFGKRVYRGSINSNIYNGFIYLPLTDEIHQELITKSKGFSTILDGGLVTIISYDYVNEDDLLGFLEISKLNNTRKFDVLTPSVKWENTIYRNLKDKSLKNDIDEIITDCGVDIAANQEDYSSLMSKIDDIKFNGTNQKDFVYKINRFIENSINKQYK